MKKRASEDLVGETAGDVLTVDDSLFASSHVMGAGIVARDSLGTFVATKGDR
jgi:hypothetical protein